MINDIPSLPNFIGMGNIILIMENDSRWLVCLILKFIPANEFTWLISLI